MLITDRELLDLIALAANAGMVGQHEEAIRRLEYVLQINPNLAQAHFLLGSQYAATGRMDDAINATATAVSCDQQLDSACFQLGLLLLSAGRMTEARLAWSPLDKLGSAAPLVLFKTGLLHMVNEELAIALDYLELGLTKPNDNQALQDEMRKIAEQVQLALKEGRGSVNAASIWLASHAADKGLH